MPVTPVTDLIVVLPGIMGSTLVQDGREVWAPTGGAVLRALSTFGGSLSALTLPPQHGDAAAPDGVVPGRVFPDLHLLPGIWDWQLGYETLLRGLQQRLHLVAPGPGAIPNLLPVAYDWRLSCRHNGRRLKGIVEPALAAWRDQGPPFADARVIFVCHSMGGQVARWYLEREGGAGITRALITMGTPFRGAAKAADWLVNGPPVLLGPLRGTIHQLARSLPSLHQLLPAFACVAGADELRTILETPLPGLDPVMVEDAMRFHGELDANRTPEWTLHAIVGFRQRTTTTLDVDAGALRKISTIGGVDEGGDGTVPRLAATPVWLPPDAPGIQTVSEQHGALQAHSAVLDAIEGIVTANPVVHRAAWTQRMALRLELPDVVAAGSAADIVVTPQDPAARDTLEAVVMDERGRRVPVALMRDQDGVHRGRLQVGAGAHRVTVQGAGSRITQVEPVTGVVLGWAADAG